MVIESPCPCKHLILLVCDLRNSSGRYHGGGQRNVKAGPVLGRATYLKLQDRNPFGNNNNLPERSVTLHSFDFTKYRLWTSLFRCRTIVNGQIVVCSFERILSVKYFCGGEL